MPLLRVTKSAGKSKVKATGTPASSQPQATSTLPADCVTSSPQQDKHTAMPRRAVFIRDRERVGEREAFHKLHEAMEQAAERDKVLQELHGGLRHVSLPVSQGIAKLKVTSY